MNHSQNSQFDDRVEPWHLTAFALGELDGETRDTVQRKLECDPELAKQLHEIQTTLDLVQRELRRSTPAVGLDEDHTRGVFEHMHSDTPAVHATQALAAKRWNGFRIGGAVGALALAASVLLLLQYKGQPKFQFGTELSQAPATNKTIEKQPDPSRRSDLAEEEELPKRGLARNAGDTNGLGTVNKPVSGENSLSSESLARDAKKDLGKSVEFDDSEYGVNALSDLSLAQKNGQVKMQSESRFLGVDKQGDINADEPTSRFSATDGIQSAQGQSDREKSLEMKSEGSEVVMEPMAAPATASSLAKAPSLELPPEPSPASAAVAAASAPLTPLGPGGSDAAFDLPLQPSRSEPTAGGSAGGFPGSSLRGRVGSGGAGGAGDADGLGGMGRNLAEGGLGGMGSGMRTLKEGQIIELRSLEHPVTDAEGLALSRRKEDRFEYRLQQLPDELKANVPSANRPQVAQGDRFDAIPETPFVDTRQQPLSTFSIDVDTASYSKLRQYVIEQNTLPSPDTVRIEEWINYFDYEYPGPTGDDPFAAHLKMAVCPWNTEHKLVRVAIQAKRVDTENRPDSNLVFLIDVSGSMAEPNKLPLVKRTLNLLTSQLRHRDRVAIVVYAGAAGCVLPSTPGSSKEAILASVNELQSGGSTNGGQGIELAYRIAKENFIPGGVNRVILCTDGDFNVGVTGNDQLVAMMKEKAASNIFLTCLGYGVGNYNDSMMEQVSNQGNGTYAMVDNELEARRIMIEQLSGTLMTVAKDVKIQVEFNPNRVGAYRLIGYENRRLAARDFDDDRKDAGEIGAGHRVTALYEVVPVGKDKMPQSESQLRYSNRTAPAATDAPNADLDPNLAREWMLLKIRSKKPEASESTKQEFVLSDTTTQSYESDGRDMDWASSVAEFGLLLRHSQLAPGIDWDRMIARAQENAGSDPYRRECLVLMQQARRLSGR